MCDVLYITVDGVCCCAGTPVARGVLVYELVLSRIVVAVRLKLRVGPQSMLTNHRTEV